MKTIRIILSPIVFFGMMIGLIIIPISIICFMVGIINIAYQLLIGKRIELNLLLMTFCLITLPYVETINFINPKI
jgi:hypothetical protein